jgi:hypothetical protein
MQKMSYCSHCAKERKFRRHVAHHVTHLVLTVATGGLWGIAWFSIWWGERKQPWHCKDCRHPVTMLSPNAQGPALAIAPATPEREQPKAQTPPVAPVVPPVSRNFNLKPRVLPHFRGELRAQ